MADRQRWISFFRANPSTLRKSVSSPRKSPVLEELENRLTPATPVVLSINPATPATPITNATSVTYAVTFGESVTGVDAADFKVVSSGTVQTAAPLVVTGTGAAYSVKVNGILGSGELRLDLLDNDTIVGGSGPLGGAGANNGSFQGRTYSILQTYPSVVSITRTTPTNPITNGASVSYTVTFSTGVTGVDAADFTPLVTIGTVAASAPQVTPVSDSVYTVTINNITGNGALGLNLVDNGTVRDADGHPLSTWTNGASFQSQQTYAVGTAPVSVMSADLNGDAKLDLVVLNRNSNSVSVLLGNGDGSFQNQQSFSAGILPRAAALGDLNGDGKPDLVLANNTGTVSVLLGNGNGTFQGQQTIAAGAMPRGVAIGDVNGDGKPDLAVANYNDNSLSILLGNGNGTFQGQQTFAAGNRPIAVALGDVTGDGKADLVIANALGNSVSVLLGNGNGAFQAQQTFAAGAGASSVALGDVNGDGKPDIAVANYSGNSLSVLLANGNGTFQGQQTFATGSSPRGAIFGDVNGDGKLDLANANVFNNNVSVFLGNGNGTFQSQQNFAASGLPRLLLLTDVNADGKPDFAIANSDNSGGGNSVSVLVGSRGGSFVGQSYTIDHAGPTVAITPVSPDPRVIAVGTVAISFNEAVQNVDSTDFTLTRGGVGVPLTAAMLTGAGSQYALDLSSVTASNGSTTLGAYVLTLNTADIKDLAGNALVSGASDSWQINSSPTTTTLSATPNASTGGALVTFTATVAPSPGSTGTVTFKDNGVAIPTATNIALVNGVATFQTSILTAGTHPITAEYSGTASSSPSTSSPQNFVVTASQPQLVSVTPNANIPNLAGAQRSRVVSMVVVFNQPVQLDINALTIALHTNNVNYDGVAQPTGYGVLPSSLSFATTDNVSWVATFVGNTDVGADGLNSLKDGVYDFRIDGAKVHPFGVPTLNLTANSTTTFHRLFGDASAPGTPAGGTAGVDFQAVLNTGDNLAFRSSFNSTAGYKAYFDFNGDGLINTADNLQFRTRFNKALNWKA